MIEKSEMTRQILEAKAALGLSWESMARKAGLSEVYTTSACLGENALAPEAAAKLVSALNLGPEVSDALARYANKGETSPAIIKEPLQYRFLEILYVYGPTMKALIEEKFGAGIMSAIDFTMEIEKVPDPAGDRVKVTMNGKFLKYKAW
jgi:cyanate lyase